VTIAGGTPTLSLNDGGTATYTGGSGSSALTFSYTVAAGQNTSDLTLTAFNLGTATVTDAAANAAVLTGAVTNPAGTLQIDTTAPDDFNGNGTSDILWRNNDGHAYVWQMTGNGGQYNGVDLGMVSNGWHIQQSG